MFVSLITSAATLDEAAGPLRDCANEDAGGQQTTPMQTKIVRLKRRG
jgi:hypothetical protein